MRASYDELRRVCRARPRAATASLMIRRTKTPRPMPHIVVPKLRNSSAAARRAAVRAARHALRAIARTCRPKSSRRMQRRKIPGTSLSVFVREVGRDEPLVSYNSTVPRNPASTMKVLTTYRGARDARARLHLAHARLCHRPDPRPGARGQPRARRRRRSVHDRRALVELRQRPAPGRRAAHHRRRDHRQHRSSRRRATTARPSTTARTAPTTCCRTRCW